MKNEKVQLSVWTLVSMVAVYLSCGCIDIIAGKPVMWEHNLIFTIIPLVFGALNYYSIHNSEKNEKSSESMRQYIDPFLFHHPDGRPLTTEEIIKLGRK